MLRQKSVKSPADIDCAQPLDYLKSTIMGAYGHLVILLHIYLLPQNTEGNFNVSCGKGYFYNKDVNHCLPCAKCDAYSIQTNPCSGTSDAVCQKCIHGNELTEQACGKCRPCRKGYFQAIPCGADRPNVCRRCRQGTFSADSSYSSLCRPCVDCRQINRETASPCRRNKDAKCGGCKKGFYKLTGVRKCLQCRTCLPGQRRLKACRNSGGGRFCGVFIKTPRVYHHSSYYVTRYFVMNTTSMALGPTTTEYRDEKTALASSDGQKNQPVFLATVTLASIGLLSLALSLVNCCRQRRRNVSRKVYQRCQISSSKMKSMSKSRASLLENDTPPVLSDFVQEAAMTSYKMKEARKAFSYAFSGQNLSCPIIPKLETIQCSGQSSSAVSVPLSSSSYKSNVYRGSFWTPKVYDDFSEFSCSITSLKSEPTEPPPPPPPPAQVQRFLPPTIPPRPTGFET